MIDIFFLVGLEFVICRNEGETLRYRRGMQPLCSFQPRVIPYDIHVVAHFQLHCPPSFRYMIGIHNPVHCLHIHTVFIT